MLNVKFLYVSMFKDQCLLCARYHMGHVSTGSTLIP